MIIDYFIRNLDFPQECTYKNMKIIFDIKKERITIFKKRKYWITIVTEIKDFNNYELENIMNFIIEKISDKTYVNNKTLIKANWFIFTETFSENIFYEINVNKNIHYNCMLNKFSLISNLNGEILFNPEKIENKVISARMKFLWNSLRKEYPLDKEKDKLFLKEVKGVLNVLEKILNDLKQNPHCA